MDDDDDSESIMLPVLCSHPLDYARLGRASPKAARKRERSVAINRGSSSNSTSWRGENWIKINK